MACLNALSGVFECFERNTYCLDGGLNGGMESYGRGGR